jgi:amidase
VGSRLVDIRAQRDEPDGRAHEGGRRGSCIGPHDLARVRAGSHTFNEILRHGRATRTDPDALGRRAAAAGAAVASRATRMLAVADGSDFMGSLRNPRGLEQVV